MKKGICFSLAIAAAAGLAGCNSGNQDVLINSAAGAALGAGVGMAVSAEKDKTEGALAGAGAGAILAGLLTDANNPQPQATTVEAAPYPAPVGSIGIGSGGDPMEEVLAVFDIALQESLTSGRQRNWGHGDFSGTIFPGKTREQFGRICRPYRSAWRSADGSGTDALLACRGGNGKWENTSG